MPELCADPKHPGTVSWGCDSLTATSTGGSRLAVGPSTSPTGSALSHLPPGLGSPGSESVCPARKEGVLDEAADPGNFPESEKKNHKVSCAV